MASRDKVREQQEAHFRTESSALIQERHDTATALVKAWQDYDGYVQRVIDTHKRSATPEHWDKEVFTLRALIDDALHLGDRLIAIDAKLTGVPEHIHNPGTLVYDQNTRKTQRDEQRERDIEANN